MELIEAIYLSLALFTVGIIVILVISFTSYKVKKKLGTDNSNSEESHELKPKLEAKNGKPIQKSKHRSKPVVKKEREKIKISDKKNSKHTSTKKKSSYKPEPKRNIITNIEQPRIEVLNKPVKDIPKVPEKETTSDKEIKKNMIDHYSDSEDDEFKSIGE